MKVHPRSRRNRAVALVAAAGTLITAVNLACAQPTITTQPQDQTNYIGETATLTIVATGIGSLAYQWQKFSTGFVNEATATNAALTLFNVQTKEAGDYRCVVTDATGMTNSATAHLYVNPPETLFISNSATGVVTLSWQGNMVLLAAMLPSSGSLDCALWFRAGDTSPVTLPLHSEPRFFRLVALSTIAELQADFQKNLSICRAMNLTNSASGCEDCIRAYFLQPSPLSASPEMEEVDYIGVHLGSCFCATAGQAIGLLRGGTQPEP